MIKYDLIRVIISILPLVIIILSTATAVSIMYYVFQKLAEKRFYTKYLPSIEGSEIQRLTLENKHLEILVEHLTEKNKLYLDIFSGMRHLVAKGQ